MLINASIQVVLPRMMQILSTICYKKPQNLEKRVLLTASSEHASTTPDNARWCENTFFAGQTSWFLEYPIARLIRGSQSRNIYLDLRYGF